tara:strand:+ start:397 stop:1515 length:1119 start_codon:yes stop_codon:yes gene_type:complete
VTRGAAAAASTLSGKQKKQSKLQRQFANLRNRIQQQSTPEAKRDRRYDRLKRQHGLDMRDMRNLKINVDVNRALNHLNVPKAITKRIPKSIRDFRFNAELGGKFRSPHKLGVREGYRKPNKGGQTIQANTKKQLQALRPNDLIGGWLDFYNKQTNYDKTKPPIGVGGIQPDDPKKGFIDFYDKQVDNTPPNNLIPLPGVIPGKAGSIRRSMADPSQTIASMYKNILGRAHDQEGLDYWTNEFTSGKQSMDDIRQNIVRSKEFQGRSDADKSAALRGIELRKERRLRGKPARFRGRPIGPWRVAHGYPSKEKRERERAKRRGGGRFGGALAGRQILGHYDKKRRAKRKAKLQNKAVEGDFAKSLAAHMAARGI